MTPEFLTHYAGQRMEMFRHQAWADSLRPSRRTQLAQLLNRLAARLEPDPARTPSPSRKAY